MDESKIKELIEKWADDAFQLAKKSFNPDTGRYSVSDDAQHKQLVTCIHELGQALGWI